MRFFLKSTIVSSFLLLTACASVGQSDAQLGQCQALRHKIRQDRMLAGPYPKNIRNAQLLNQMEIEYRSMNCSAHQIHHTPQ